MNTLSCLPFHTARANRCGGLEISDFSRINVSARSNAEISVMTADGDKVMISAGSSISAEHTTYDYLGRLQGQTAVAHFEEFQISTSTQATATVQGALDEDELDDIRKLLDVLQTTAGDFFSGESDGLFGSLPEIGDLGSIASFEAELSYSREVSAERIRSVTASAEAATGGAAEIAANSAPAMPKSEKSFLETLISLAQHLEDEKIIDTLPKRFTQLFNKLAQNLALDEHEKKLVDLVRSKFLKRSETPRI